MKNNMKKLQKDDVCMYLSVFLQVGIPILIVVILAIVKK